MKQLLILDDDPAVAQTIAFVAEEAGFEVECLDSPEPFFDAVQSRPASHVALDLIMPGMDGVEVLRRLASSRCQASIILTSGMGRKVLESAQATAAERGLNIVGVLPKPFRQQLLRELLGRGAELVRALPTPAASRRLPAAADLAAAIEDRCIVVAAQPKLDLATRQVVGAEILARWNDPAFGTVPPDVFVAIAEANGLMMDMTRLVLDQALTWFAGSPLRDCGSVAVNLSTSCLVDVALADEIEAACRALAVPPDRLILEITESTAMDRTADSFDTLTRLRLKGFQLSIDDFGTGYSSLAQLARLPLSEIKIDRSFVLRLHSSEDARRIVDATVRLAQGMGLASVAEGVEDASTLETLAELGCSLAQGYHIAKPMPGPEFDAWLRRRGPATAG